jgi:hypothetical protein
MKKLYNGFYVMHLKKVRIYSPKLKTPDLNILRITGLLINEDFYVE